MTGTAVRRLAAKHGHRLCKSRARHISANNLGEYMLIDVEKNFAVLGWHYDANLDDVYRWLTE